MGAREDIVKLLLGAAKPAEKAPGIRAYHSSPYDFERFDASRIGKGQGAQSYGHGLYFAESPAVSGLGGEYWKEFARRFTSGPDSPEAHAVRIMEGVGGSRGAAAADVEKVLLSGEKTAYSRERLQSVLDLLRSDKQVGPRTYEVNIRAQPEQLLDWDRPLREQAVASKLPSSFLEMAQNEAYNRAISSTTKARADELYSIAADPLKASGGFGMEAGRKKPELSTVLSEAGIPGIRYLDQGSRGLNNPAATSNYVMFPGSEHLIDIMKKYGVAGGAIPTMGALADQSRLPEEAR